MARSILFLFLHIIFVQGPTPILGQSRTCDLSQFRECMVATNEYGAEALFDYKTNSSEYNQLNHQWNLRKHNDPIAYFLPTSTEDVQNIVRCARQSGLRVIPKGGGHSYESFTFGTPGETCELIIDFRLMNDVHVNEENKTATILPGALLGEIYAKLWDYGFGMVSGDCVSVGIAGYTLGGGNSRTSHLYGLAIDNLLEFEMVDANGDVHIVNAQQNEDLFWAMRGVGSGFIGIVTRFEFKLFQASQIQVTFLTFYFDMHNIVHALNAWQEWNIWTRENEPYVHNVFYTGDPLQHIVYTGLGIKIYTTHIYHPEDQPRGNATFLAKASEIMSVPSLRSMETIFFPTYMEYIRKIGFANVYTDLPQSQIDWKQLRSYNIVQLYHKRKSFFVSQKFSPELLVKLGDLLQYLPSGNVWFGMWSEGGKSAQVPSNATAYAHRDTWFTFLLTYEGINDPELINEGMTYIRNVFEEVKSMDKGGTYQNYLDLELAPEHWNRYYKGNLKRLIDTKKKWDKDNYFKNPQSLPLSY